MTSTRKITTPTKIILLLVSSLTIMAGATIAPALPQMAEVYKDLPNAAFLSKLVLTIPALAIGIFAPIAGLLVDRLGRLKVLFPALALYAIAGSSGFFVTNLYFILVGRLFLGIAVACIMTTSITLVGDYLSGEPRAKFIGIQAAFMSFGGAIFVSLGGLMADMSWRYPFLIYLFSLVVLVGGLFFLHEPIREKQTTKERTKSIFTGWKSIQLILLTAFIAMIIFYMLPVQIPFYLKSIGVKENKLAGIAIAIATLASTVTGFYYGRLRTKYAINTLFIAVFLFMGIGYALISLSNTYTFIIISMIVTGFGVGLLMPNLNTWLLQSSSEENRGKFSGLLSSALFFGQFMSPIVVAPLINHQGLSFSFLVVAIVLVGLSTAFL